MCFVSASCLPILLLLYSLTFYTQSAIFLRLTNTTPPYLKTADSASQASSPSQHSK